MSAEPFFSSRWIDGPAHVTELRRRPARRASAPAGVAVRDQAERRARPRPARLATRPQTTSAARFTRSGTLAAPVLLTMERCRLDAIRAVVVNSGNANAATGRRGLEDAAKMQGAAAIAAGVGPRARSRSPRPA